MTTEKKANTEYRANIVKSMDLIARTVNDEDIFEYWLEYGVADGDIDENTTAEQIAAAGYCEDETFSGLLTAFAKLMRAATKDGELGALFADGVLS